MTFQKTTWPEFLEWARYRRFVSVEEWVGEYQECWTVLTFFGGEQARISSDHGAHWDDSWAKPPVVEISEGP